MTEFFEPPITKLVNLKCNKYDVRIDRKSIFGNPFVLGIHGNRDEVCDKYDVYFNKRIMEDIEFRKSVLQLKGKILGCHCVPLRCHGLTILNWLKK